jgi:hypothetical protein
MHLMRPKKAAKILRKGQALANLPAVQVGDDAEKLLFPWLASIAAAQLAVERGAS